MLSVVNGTIYQGVISSPPKNPIFLDLTNFKAWYEFEPQSKKITNCGLYSFINFLINFSLTP